MKSPINEANNGEIPVLNGSVLLAQNSIDDPVEIYHTIKSTGASVTLVENGQQIIAKTLTDDFALILVDINMPVLNGEETLKGLKQLGNDMPVYALSSLSTLKDIDKYRQMGFKGVLTKPVALPQLYSVLQTHLSSLQQPAKVKNELPDALKVKIAELKPMFLASLKIQQTQLSEYLECDDFAQIAKILHVIKGNGGNFGYHTLTDVANSALISLRLEQLDEAPALIAKVLVCVDKILSCEENFDTKN